MLACGCRTPQTSDGEDDQPGTQGSRSKRRSGRTLLHSALTLVTRCRRAGPQPTMPPAERTMKAAILIQAWYRRYLARMEIRRRYTWTIFQSIEYAGEQDQVKLYNFFNALLTHMPTAKPDCWTSTAVSSPSESVSELEATYRGLHISDPLTRADMDNLIETYRRKKHHKLHEKYVASILHQATNALKHLPNLNPVSVAISKQITVVGDLHGKLDDLLVIFHKNGLPSAENPYIFNGDFVDRGKKGLEVLLILLSCLLVFPGGVFLNRGNHEDHVMNTRYGFIGEVRGKYKAHADHLLTLIEGVYRWLPLGSLVNNKVLVVHGGISDVTDLNWIKKLERSKYVSLLRPPLAAEAATGTSSGELVDKLEWKQVFDILWSDPQTTNGCVPNSLRGAGTYFGPDVTHKFLKKFNLLYLIRSHECKAWGYELVHGEKVITIFSASNYYEQGSNKGAYVKLVGHELSPHFVQFNAVGTRGKKLTFRQRVGLVETSALKELSCQISAKKEQLSHAFKAADTKNTGLISTSDWCNAMEAGTGLNLPWRMLRRQLVTTEASSNLVEYGTTFQPKPGRANAGLTVVETLYRNKASLEAIFKIIDKDSSGYISRDEFAEACTLLSKHLSEPISPENFTQLVQSMDRDHDGQVDLNEFLETFRLVDQSHTEAVEESSSDEEK